MYLSQLKLWNFRKFGSDVDNLDTEKPDLIVPFTSGLNVLIGMNDSGKTAIVDAIKLALDTHSAEWVRLDTDDFYNQSSQLRIECRFDGFSDDEAKHFTEWLGIDGEGENAKLFLTVILNATKQGDKVLPYDICAGIDDDGYRLHSEAREYLKTTYLKPLRDAKLELMPRKSSRLSQILAGHEAFKGKNDDHWLMDGFRKFKKAVEDYFKEEKGGDKKGQLLREKIEEYLESFFGEKIAVNFFPSDKKLKEILEILKLSLNEENRGLGSQNLLFIAAELLNLERSDWTGLRLALIEELEAHLHPQAQLKVVSFLQELIDKKNNNLQLILTTHSPNLASKIKLQNLIICNDVNVYPIGSDYTMLEKDDYKFLERFLDVTKANLFFAKGVILVEGWAEELILPALAKKIGIDLTYFGVSIVNLASTAFLRYSKIFQRKNDPEMSIPVSIITDLDIKPDEENNLYKNTKTTNAQAKKKKIEEQYNGQKVRAFVSPHWTLEYCLANSSTLGEIFFSSVITIHPQIDQSNPSEAVRDKLEKGSLKKAEIAQDFVDKLNNSSITKTEIEKDGDLKYLLDAIKYASGI
jgi:putative ATP-dependent endonuclease of the OLD family